MSDANAIKTHYPVAIIGSGPTGLTLANLLGVLGVAALVVERNHTTVDEPRAVSIDDESLRTMQAAGVVDEVLKEVVPGYGSHYFSPSGICFAKVQPTGAPYGFPRRNAFRQPVLEAQLKAALARFSTVHALYGWRMERYAQTDRSVILQIKGEQEAARAITCDYLIGCDGAASTVRDQQGIMLEGETFNERWLIIDLERNENTTPHTTVFCDARRPGISLPGPYRTRRFEFKLLPGERDEDLLDPATVDRLLRTHGADPNSTIRRKVVYRFHARIAPRWRVGRVFFAGDAAHLTPPFAGQGMNSGIRDAHNLAWKLAAVLAGDIGARLLDSYQEERRDHVQQMIDLALMMGRIMSPPNWAMGALMQAGLLALNVCPPARDYIAQMKYKPQPRFAAGFLVPDGKSPRLTLVGRLIAQPRVRTSSGEEVLLDELLGNRFVLLARSLSPDRAFCGFTQPIWSRLKTSRVCLLPRGSSLSAAADVVTGGEIDGTLGDALSDYADSVLLLRPDHYIAASIPLDRIEQSARQVASLLDATWDESAAATALAQGPQRRARIRLLEADLLPKYLHRHRASEFPVPGR
jgi:3-(3-hydroxy-phenyl)propionate hydroxylase